MSQYNWNDGLPRIHRHSLCKHDILRDYLMEYIDIRARPLPRFPEPKFNLTIVDGFAGGGCYTYEGKEKPGSPIVIIESIKEAISSFEAKHGENVVKFNIDVICIEKEKNNMQLLKEAIRLEDYRHGEIITWQGKFEEYLPRAIDHINTRGKKRGRGIFFLDQYGYSSVFMDQLRMILQKTKSEIILTFAIDALTTFFTDPKKLSTLRGLELSDAKIKFLLELAKDDEYRKAAIEHTLSEHIHKSSGAKFYTPFLINSEASSWGYWLVHLSDHYKARSVMVSLHWKHNNRLAHYGGAGLDMLGHDPHIAECHGQLTLGDVYRFDKYARERSMQTLPYEVTKYLYDSDKKEMLVSDLFSKTYNGTPASMEMFKEALWTSSKDGQIVIHRRKMESIKDDDVIIVPEQPYFLFPKNKKG